MNEDLRRALNASTDDHLTIVDPINNESYVLLPAEEYERLSAERLIRDTYPLQEEVAHAAGWDEPEMDEYNNYDANRAQRSQP